MTGEQILDIIQWVNLSVYVLLGGIALTHFVRTKNRPAGWITLTFLVIAGVSIVGRIIPDDGGDSYALITKFIVAILALFPYFLFRFATTFYPPSKAAELIAGALTALVAISVFLLPELPQQGAEQPPAWRAWVFALLIQWTALSVIAAYRLWKQGNGQPPVARRRMRLMAVAATLLSIIIIVSGSAGGDQSLAIRIANGILGTFAALIFFFGFSPPEWVRATWRRPALEAMRSAVRDLLSATSEEEVIRGLIPHAKEIVGARAVAFLDPDNHVLHQESVSTEMLGQIAPELQEGAPPEEETDHVVMKFPFGSMVVWTSPYAPFFGGEEFEILTYLGTLAHLALERTRAATLKLQLAEAQLRRRQALEINDNIVQGLAVAKYAFELGDEDKARSSLDQTLTAAKNIISELLSEIDPNDPLGPSLLTRNESASAALRDSAGS